MNLSYPEGAAFERIFTLWLKRGWPPRVLCTPHEIRLHGAMAAIFGKPRGDWTDMLP